MPKSMSLEFMERTKGGLTSLASQAMTFAETQGRGRGESVDYGESIGGECGEDGWVNSDSVDPLSRGFRSSFPPCWKA